MRVPMRVSQTHLAHRWLRFMCYRPVGGRCTGKGKGWQGEEILRTKGKERKRARFLGVKLGHARWRVSFRDTNDGVTRNYVDGLRQRRTRSGNEGLISQSMGRRVGQLEEEQIVGRDACDIHRQRSGRQWCPFIVQPLCHTCL